MWSSINYEEEQYSVCGWRVFTIWIQIHNMDWYFSLCGGTVFTVWMSGTPCVEEHYSLCDGAVLHVPTAWQHTALATVNAGHSGHGGHGGDARDGGHTVNTHTDGGRCKYTTQVHMHMNQPVNIK